MRETFQAYQGMGECSFQHPKNNRVPPFSGPLESSCCHPVTTCLNNQSLEPDVGGQACAHQEPRHNLEASDISTPWGPQKLLRSETTEPVCEFHAWAAKWGGHRQMQTKFQPFYSKQLCTMYKYCILAHMKIQLLRHPEMCSYTLQDHSQRECTICSRQSAFDKSEDYYPPALYPVSGNIYNVVRKGQLYLLGNSMKYSYLQIFRTSSRLSHDNLAKENE